MNKQTAEETAINVTLDGMLTMMYAYESNINKHIRYNEYVNVKNRLYASQGCVYTAYVTKNREAKRAALVELVSNLSVARSIIRHLGEGNLISLKFQHKMMLQFSKILPQAQGWLNISQ